MDTVIADSGNAVDKMIFRRTILTIIWNNVGTTDGEEAVHQRSDNATPERGREAAPTMVHCSKIAAVGMKGMGIHVTLPTGGIATLDRIRDHDPGRQLAGEGRAHRHVVTRGLTANATNEYRTVIGTENVTQIIMKAAGWTTEVSMGSVGMRRTDISIRKLGFNLHGKHLSA